MDISRYRHDVIYFLEHEYYVPDTEELVSFDGGWEWQRDILRDIFGMKDAEGKRQYTAGTISTPRQQGKSLILQCVGLYMLIAGGKNLGIFSIACDKDQAALVPDRVKRSIRLNRRLDSAVRITRDVISCPANGNSWSIMSSDQASAPGIVADVLLWDELGMLPEYQWNLVYLLLPAMSARREPLMLIASTVGEFEEGPLEDFMKIAREGKDDHTYLYHTNEIRSPLTNEAQVERDRLLMPEAVFARHYENRVVRGASFLSDEDIESIIIPESGDPASDYPRFVGCDWGLTRDKCAVVSIAKDHSDGMYYWDESRVFRGSKRNPVDLNEATEVVKDIHSRKHPERIVFDKWQAVSTIQTLQAEWGPRVEGYDFSQTSRKRLFQNLFTLIRGRQLKLYSDILRDCWKGSCQTCPHNWGCVDQDKHEFLRELQGLQCDSDFRVTHGKCGDDIAVALALALLPAVRDKRYEVYSSSQHFTLEDLGIQ